MSVALGLKTRLLLSFKTVFQFLNAVFSRDGLSGFFFRLIINFYDFNVVILDDFGVFFNF